jgi:hypothetical protein
MRSIFTVFFIWAPFAYGAKTVTVQGAISAYAKPDFDSPVIFTVAAGSSIVVADKFYGGFRKVKAVVDGRARVGYITAAELVAQHRPPKEKKWGGGGGFVFTRLSQGQKVFIAADRVSYTISNYQSTDLNPALTVQMGQKNFWRFNLGYKTVSLRGNSVSELGKKEDISIDYKMAAFGLQGGWGLFSRTFYGGLGVEVDKAMSGKVKIGEHDLSGQTEYPDYIGGHLFAGAQIRFTRSLSAFFEGRMGTIFNQDPKLTVVEMAGSLLYWL